MLGEPGKRPTRHLKIDMELLSFAFENSNSESQNYLDLETGEVVLVTDETSRELETIYEELGEAGDDKTARFVEAVEKRGLPDSQRELLLEADRVEAGFGTRYIRVPIIDSHEAYGDMDEFIETVQDERLQVRLLDAIRGRGAFHRFKDVLLGYPNERERWFKFKDAQMRQRVLNWLEEEGIEMAAPEG